MSGGGTDKFCLRWNDFETNISSAFRDIRDDKDLFDVTLSCGPRHVQAHKLILSACSPFFRTVFKQNPHQHPLLYLKGIQYDDLQSVLNFMYHGEVNVAQEDLNNFLAVAEELKIKGLTQNNSEESGKSSSNSHPKQEPVKHRAPSLPKPPPLKMPRPAPTAAVAAVEDDDIQEVVAEVKAEPGSSRMEVLEQYQDTSQQGDMVTYDEGYDYADYGEGEAEGYGGHMVEAGADQDKGFDPDEYIVMKEAGRAECCVCGRDFLQKSDAKRHILSVHSTVKQQVQCDYCQIILKNKNSLNAHHRAQHGIYKLNAK